MLHWIPKKWILCSAVAFALLILLSANISFADCYVSWNCGGSSQCAQAYGGSSGQRPVASCSGWVRQDAVSSCSCSASGGASIPTSADPSVVIGTQLGNMLYDVLTAPAQPKTPEQIEAERQAEIARQQREAERQAKIQTYLNGEAAKQQKKNADLDKEAQDSMSLLDPKPAASVAMSDQDLLASDQETYAPKVCTEELQGLSDDLNSFANEAQKEGLQLTVNDALKTTRQSLDSLKSGAADAAASKLGVKQYTDDYKVLKTEVDKIKKDLGYMVEIKKCVSTKGCSLIELNKKYNEEFKEWLKGLSTQGIHEAADRVDKAAAFYRDYTKRLEQRNEKIMNGAVKCLGN